MPMKTVEEERNEWLTDNDQARVIHTFDGKRHKVELSSKSWDEGSMERTASGSGQYYEEALLVALRNWEDQWGSVSR